MLGVVVGERASIVAKTVRGVIVDLDRPMRREPKRPLDALAIIGLTSTTIAFAAAVWMGRPATAPVASLPAIDSEPSISSASVARGVLLTPLVLTPRPDVELAFMPDRLANEAAPSTLRSVVVIRGSPGVASVEGPAVISWTENGIAYWMASPTRSIDDLIDIANQLR
jgi:hypothetical protein